MNVEDTVHMFILLKSLFKVYTSLNKCVSNATANLYYKCFYLPLSTEVFLTHKHYFVLRNGSFFYLIKPSNENRLMQRSISSEVWSESIEITTITESSTHFVIQFVTAKCSLTFNIHFTYSYSCAIFSCI